MLLTLAPGSLQDRKTNENLSIRMCMDGLYMVSNSTANVTSFIKPRSYEVLGSTRKKSNLDNYSVHITFYRNDI